MRHILDACQQHRALRTTKRCLPWNCSPASAPAS
ncbi:hypothetical protein [Ectopseudomonas oleovorans]|nr:hypothetical protein [Pseudomonas oleovorans]